MSTSTHAIDTHVDGLRRGELLISFCSHCEAVRFPPGGVCPSCHEASTPQWRAVAARGKVWSFAVFHKGYDPSFRLPTPYVVAIVELDCGALLYTNMPTTHPEDLAIGQLVERAAKEVYRNSPPLSPSSFDSAIAEIAARQNELDEPPRQMPPRRTPPTAPQSNYAPQQYAPQGQFAAQQHFAPPPAYAPQPQFAPQQPYVASQFAPPMAPAPQAPPPGPDFSSLERHLLKITSQIESLQRPDHVEQSIAAFRSELAEIRHAITEAMPRRAIESIENEIRSLSRRIDETRSSGIDSQALAGIERALAEIREVLFSLKPAEQLAGYDEAIRNLHAKLDLILRANDDPSTVHQLEGAIAALRSIVSNVASNDALARLSDDVHMLSAKVDQLAHSAGHGDALAMIEQRIAALTSTIESREPPRPAESNNNEYLENAIRSLSERIDRMPVGNDNASAFAHLEQRVSYLLERVEAATEPRGNNNLGRVEDALQDILRHLETQHANLVTIADNASRQSFAPPPPQMDPGLIDAVKRELSDIRFSQTETDRRTQDALALGAAVPAAAFALLPRAPWRCGK